ncbi:MAG: DUF3018 family protein [Alphaproteobacteria bacterium]|nr:MAG: DUF3018 family protein [Alphaproteobacteria bacterium]
MPPSSSSSPPSSSKTPRQKNDASPSRQSKFARYRARKRAKGLREIRLWVPDVDAPEFQERLDRAVAAINASKDGDEALRGYEAGAAEVWNDVD